MEESGVFPGLSLMGNSGGHTRQEVDGANSDQRSIMMCIEVRIRCTQPPSRGFSGSLPTLARASARSAELRHQLAVFLSDLTPESASHLKNAAFLLVYLYRPFSGVTLARKQMVPAIGLAPGNPSTVMFLGACDR